MVKVFTKNKNSKIELTEEELKSILDEAYWEGYNNNKIYTWTSPMRWNQPYFTTSTTNSSTITLNSPEIDSTTSTCSNLNTSVKG